MKLPTLRYGYCYNLTEFLVYWSMVSWFVLHFILVIYSNTSQLTYSLVGPQASFICYLAVPRATWGHCQDESLTHLMLITALFSFNPKVTGRLITRLGPNPGWAPNVISRNWLNSFFCNSAWCYGPMSRCVCDRVGFFIK